MKDKENNLIDNKLSFIKNHIVQAIIGLIALFLLTIALEIFLPAIFNFINYFMRNHPIFGGVIFSWFFAAISTLIVIIFGYINHKKKDQTEKILIENNKILAMISIAVLFYISINLASEAITEKGVPIFSDSYKIGNFTNIAPQDVFLILLACIIILLIFIAPYYIYKLNIKHIFPISILVSMIMIIIGLFFLFNSPYANISEQPQNSNYTGNNSEYLFSWDEIPGNDKGRLIEFLNQHFTIEWVKTAEIEKIDGRTIKVSGNNFILLSLNHEKTNVNLTIDDGRTYEFIAKTENGKLNIYTSEKSPISGFEQNRPFIFTLIAGVVLLILIHLKRPDRVEKFKDYSNDLFWYFCFIPALIVASLALIDHKLITYPNYPGHIVVGFLFISGFATVMILTTISLKSEIKTSLWIWGKSVVLSLIMISSFSILFLYFKSDINEMDTFKKFLMFSIAIILIILQYGFAYERLFKYRFTEWWRRKWRPIAMICSIILIVIVNAFDPVPMLWIFPQKLLILILALFIVFCSPWIFGLWEFRKHIEWKDFGRFKLLKIPLPQYQAIVLIKVKTDKGILRKVVEKVDDMASEGVYKTMVVRGEYDMCLLVEGVDDNDIIEKILKIRIEENEDGSVINTTTLTDISEFFDKEVRQYGT